MNPTSRPSPADLAAAYGRTIPDLIAPDLRVLFVGINPGLWSAAVGHHFARPGNRFWPTLHRSGFTERQLRPEEQGELLHHGLGITNLVDRATARAEELNAAELIEGGRRLLAKVREYQPAFVAIVGVVAYRTAFARRGASVGAQEEKLGDARIWVLPNPSGLNAHYTLDGFAAEFAALRKAAIGTGNNQAAESTADD